jgi:hypothetical protein
MNWPPPYRVMRAWSLGTLGRMIHRSEGAGKRLITNASAERGILASLTPTEFRKIGRTDHNGGAVLADVHVILRPSKFIGQTVAAIGRSQRRVGWLLAAFAKLQLAGGATYCGICL